jgi:hypothetical protein
MLWHFIAAVAMWAVLIFKFRSKRRQAAGKHAPYS